MCKVFVLGSCQSSVPLILESIPANIGGETADLGLVVSQSQG